jgi:hypothetical protein
MVTMTEVTLTTPERPKRRSNGAAHGPVLVSGAKLATHFGVSRQHVERLTGRDRASGTRSSAVVVADLISEGILH